MRIKYRSGESVNWTQEEVDTYLLQNGFQMEWLEHIRSIPDYSLRLDMAGERFSEIGWNNFSGRQLGMVTMSQEQSRSDRIIAITLSKRYANKRDDLNKSLNINTNCMQLFREDTNNYHGNLVDAKRVWPKFTPQTRDWQNEITIPLKIDRATAQILGIIWVDGAFEIQKDAKNPDKLRLQGRMDDEALYATFVVPYVKQLFNYFSGVRTKERKGTFEGLSPHRRPTTYFTSTVSVSSTAIVTWLMHDLEYKLVSKNIDRTIPKLDWNNVEISKGFLEGILASRGNNLPNGALYFRVENDDSFRSSLRHILELNTVPYSESLRDVYISRKEVSKMLLNYELCNPRHMLTFRQQNSSEK